MCVRQFQWPTHFQVVLSTKTAFTHSLKREEICLHTSYWIIKTALKTQRLWARLGGVAHNCRFAFTKKFLQDFCVCKTVGTTLMWYEHLSSKEQRLFSRGPGITSLLEQCSHFNNHLGKSVKMTYVYTSESWNIYYYLVVVFFSEICMSLSWTILLIPHQGHTLYIAPQYKAVELPLVMTSVLWTSFAYWTWLALIYYDARTLACAMFTINTCFPVRVFFSAPFPS